MLLSTTSSSGASFSKTFQAFKWRSMGCWLHSIGPESKRAACFNRLPGVNYLERSTTTILSGAVGR